MSLIFLGVFFHDASALPNEKIHPNNSQHTFQNSL